MNQDDAIGAVFADKEDQVRRVFATGSEEVRDVIVVFTGYGHALADHAVRLVEASPTAHIYILGPDSNPWKSDPKANAESYREYIGANYDEVRIPLGRIFAEPGLETKYTSGQARTLVKTLTRRLDWRRVALVTAAYHQPRAYMTVVKALLNYRLAKQVRILATPLGREDWSVPDSELKDNASWVSSMTTECDKIKDYQKKGDVACWKDLDAYLRPHFPRS